MITWGQKVGFAGSTVTIGLQVGSTANGHRAPCGRIQPDSLVGHSLGHGTTIFGQEEGQVGLFLLGQGPFFDRIHVLGHSLGLEFIRQSALSGDAVKKEREKKIKISYHGSSKSGHIISALSCLFFLLKLVGR